MLEQLATCLRRSDNATTLDIKHGLRIADTDKKIAMKGYLPTAKMNYASHTQMRHRFVRVDTFTTSSEKEFNL